MLPDLFTLPNLLTLLRLALVPPVGYALVSGHSVAAGALFAVAAATDALDGWLARRLDQVTRLGQILDPVADKALVNTAMLAAAALGLVPLWFALVVLVRDGFVLASCCVTRALGLATEFNPGWLGKGAVAAQMLILAAVLLPQPAWLPWEPIAAVMIPVAAALAIASALGYVVAWTRRLVRRLA